MIEGRFEAHEIAQQLWGEYDGIRARIYCVLEGDEISEREEILAAVCVYYLRRIFEVESPIQDMSSDEYGIYPDGEKNQSYYWYYRRESDPPFSTLETHLGYPPCEKPGYGIALYVYGLLHAHASEVRLRTYNVAGEAFDVWRRLEELGLAKKSSIGSFESIALGFLPADVYERLLEIARNTQSD